MKDEEMAEQFADNISGLELTCSLLSAKDKNHAYRLGRYDGFLAGLKAGRPQWHDLQKDPNDLPDTDRIVYVQTKSDTGNAYHNNDGWDSTQVSGMVIAWCELPLWIRSK